MTDEPLSPAEVEALGEVRDAAGELGAPLVTIGASSRELILDRRVGITPHRTTTDWDAAVELEDWTAFERFVVSLAARGFHRHREPHRFEHTNGLIIDIVPFGGLARPDGVLAWPPDGREMSTLGLRQAYETGEDVEIAGGRIRVARLRWLVALKLFAFRDRGAQTLHDLEDVDIMLRHATEALQERVFEELAADLATGRLDFDTAGAFLIGMDLANEASLQELQVLRTVLEGLLGESDLATLARVLGGAAVGLRARDQVLARAEARFAALHSGLATT